MNMRVCGAVRYSECSSRKLLLLCLSDLISHPMLASFPQLLEQPEVMDALRVGSALHAANQLDLWLTHRGNGFRLLP